MAHVACLGLAPDPVALRFHPRPTIAAAAVLLLAFALRPGQALAKPAAAPELQGVVTQVIDGNTLTFTPAGGTPVRVRLRDVDAPESCQAWGVEARRALSEWALNKPASVRGSGKDRAGRVLGVVTVEGVNLNQHMVEEGHAWSIRTRWDQGPLVRQERVAHSLGRGLHGQPGAMMPRDFRRAYAACPVAAAQP